MFQKLGSGLIDKRLRILLALVTAVAMVTQLVVGVSAESELEEPPVFVEDENEFDGAFEIQGNNGQGGPGKAGGIVIKKTVIGGSDETFTFTVTEREKNNDNEVHHFSSDPIPSGGSFTVPNPKGTWYYVITEDAKPGWKISKIICGNQGNIDIFEKHGKVQIKAQPEKLQECEFFNERIQQEPTTGSITIVKNAPGAEPTEEFTFEVSQGVGTQTLKGSNDSETVTALAPGQYTITENPTADWKLQSAACEDAEGKSWGQQTKNSMTGTLQPGDDIVCTFTNIYTPRPGSLKIIKLAPRARSWPQTPFAFTVNYGDNTKTVTKRAFGKIGGFVLPDLAAGTTVTVSENFTKGWEIYKVSCVGEGTDVEDNIITYTVQPGKTAVCTVINKRVGDKDPEMSTLTLYKTVEGDWETPGEGFPIEVRLDEEGPDTHLVRANESAGLGFPVEVGTHVDLAENLDELGSWRLDRAYCINENTEEKWELSGDSVSVSFTMPTDNVSCYFYNEYDDNDQPGTLTILKLIEGFDSTQPDTTEFTFNIDADREPLSDIGHGQSDTWYELEKGTYTVTEGSLTNWTVFDRVCRYTEMLQPHAMGVLAVDGPEWERVGTHGVEVTLGPGDHITCEFTNKYTPPSGGDQGTGTQPTPTPTTPGDDDDSGEQTGITPESPLTGPGDDDDTVQELDTPPPAAAPDLPFTGGNYLLHLLSGSALTGIGALQLVRRRKRNDSDEA